jgi:hypothetical protein
VTIPVNVVLDARLQTALECVMWVAAAYIAVSILTKLVECWRCR